MASGLHRAAAPRMHLESSALPADVFRWRFGAGSSNVTIVARASFELLPLRSAYADAAGSAELPSDAVPFKPLREVVVVGSAFAPRAQPAREISARFVVGGIDKAIGVYCDRKSLKGGALEAHPFVEMPLGYERAARGRVAHVELGAPNPMGLPLARDEHGALRLPNLVPVGYAFDRFDEDTPVVGLGPLPPSFPERAAFAMGRAQGPLDPAVETVYPDTLRPEWFSSAPSDQRTRDPFGDEIRVALTNLHARFDRLSTTLPRLSVGVKLTSSARDETRTLVADTVWIDAARARCHVTYRAYFPVHADEKELRGALFVERDDDEPDGTATVSLSPGRALSSSKATPFEGTAPPSGAPPSAARASSAAPHVPTGTRAMPAYAPAPLAPAPLAHAPIAPAPIAHAPIAHAPIAHAPIAPSPPIASAKPLSVPEGLGGRSANGAPIVDARDASDRAAATDAPSPVATAGRKRRREPRELVPRAGAPALAGEVVHHTARAVERARTLARGGELQPGTLPREPAGVAERDVELARVVLQAAHLTHDELEGSSPGRAVVLEGVLRLAFATRDWLRAALGYLRPFAVTDARLKELLEATTAVVDDGWSAEPNLSTARARLREAYGASASPPSPSGARRDGRPPTLDAVVESTLIERRQGLGVRVFGEPRLALELTLPDGPRRPPVECYALEAARDCLPAIASFRARVLGVVRLRQREGDGPERCVDVEAIVRVAEPRSAS